MKTIFQHAYSASVGRVTSVAFGSGSLAEELQRLELIDSKKATEWGIANDFVTSKTLPKGAVAFNLNQLSVPALEKAGITFQLLHSLIKGGYFHVMESKELNYYIPDEGNLIILHPLLAATVLSRMKPSQRKQILYGPAAHITCLDQFPNLRAAMEDGKPKALCAAAEAALSATGKQRFALMLTLLKKSNG